LHIFSDVWLSGNFPPSWRKPLPKPDKDASAPDNCRPIALTSCLCKTFRATSQRAPRLGFWKPTAVLRDVNVVFVISAAQLTNCCVWKTFVRKAFVRREHVVTVSHTFSKSRNTMWRDSILRDMYNAKLRRRLPDFIAKFLSDRQFRVLVGSRLSDVYRQEMGVPQGSILSVPLFIQKINSIVQCLPPNVRCSLYVDDFLICYRSRNMRSIERVPQRCLDSIQTWADDNGFQFSKTKTVCMLSYQQCALPLNP
jgi:hypothetical protein